MELPNAPVVVFTPMVPFFVGAGAVVPVRLVALVPGVPLSVAGIPPMYKPKVPVGALALPDAPDETALILALLDWVSETVHCAYTVMLADTGVV